MKRLVRSGRVWVGLAAISLGLSYATPAWAGGGSSGGSSGGSHGSSGGSSGGYYSHGSSGGSSGGYYSHGSSGGSSGGYNSHGSSGGSSGGYMNGDGGTSTTTTPQGASVTRRTSVLLTIVVPADAKLYIENQPTQLTGTRREFISPKLESGKEYIYTVKAEVEKNGEKVTGTEQLPVKAGDHATVQFGPSTQNPSVLVADRR